MSMGEEMATLRVWERAAAVVQVEAQLSGCLQKLYLRQWAQGGGGGVGAGGGGVEVGGGGGGVEGGSYVGDVAGSVLRLLVFA